MSGNTIHRVLAGGRIELRQLLGEGGMGKVFLAVDKQRRCKVVVKVPHSSMLHDEGIVARFQQEAAVMQQLTHPNVVRILNCGSENGMPFMVLEYVEGGSLEDRILPSTESTQRVPQPESSLLTWVPGVAEALDYMHGHGVIHRDIKPGNILFTTDGVARLSDFGIAKFVSDYEQGSGLTAQGDTIGTADYMSPEVACGRQIDGLADQYSLAATVFESLTGRLPFVAATSYEVQLLQASDQKAPRLLDVQGIDVSESVNRAVARALEKNPQDRFEKCVEFASALIADLVPAESSAPRNQSAAAFQRTAVPMDTDTTQMPAVSIATSGQVMAVDRESLRKLKNTFSRLTENREPGVCCFCGHKHSPLPESVQSRQYCAGCGIELWVKCRPCSSGIFILAEYTAAWDRFCAKCGQDLTGEVASSLRSAIDCINVLNKADSSDAAGIRTLAVSASESISTFEQSVTQKLQKANAVAELTGKIREQIDVVLGSVDRQAEVAWQQLDTNRPAKLTKYAEQIQIYLKRFPNASQTAVAAERLERIKLEIEINLRARKGDFEGLLAKVEQLVQADESAREVWATDRKLTKLLGKSPGVADCRIYLKLLPEGKKAAAAKAIVSPALRRQLMNAMHNRSLRQEYLSCRVESEQDEDTSRGFNMCVLLWTLLGLVVAGGLLVGGQVVGAIIAGGSGLLIGLLLGVIGDPGKKSGPLPFTAHLLGAAFIPRRFRV